MSALDLSVSEPPTAALLAWEKVNKNKIFAQSKIQISFYF